MIGFSRRMMQGALGAASACAVLVGVTTFSPEANAGISNTRHNLTSNANGVGPRNQSNQTDLCVFCHTPHGADVTTASAPPLWNKNLQTGATYRTYQNIGSSTIDGTFATDGLAGSPAIGSVSLACLSCHDGAQAMDNIINTPGSGTTTTAGGVGGGSLGASFTWTGPRVDANGFLTGPANLGVPLATAPAGARDLSNDHPIGIQYCGGFTTGTTCRDPDFRAVSGTAGNFYVETGGTFGGASATTREKTDMILFNRTFGAAGAGPSVECGTCHDPHTDVGASATQVAFLRVPNTNSNLCLSCHVK